MLDARNAIDAGRWRFGQRSESRLATCDHRLQQVARLALSLSPFDLVVLEGHRSLARQQALYQQGASKIDGVKRMGNHQYSPSRAIDIAPHPIDWQDTRRFYVLAGVMEAAARISGVQIRGGYDWDGDGEFNDQTFHDLPHFELVAQ